MTKIKYTPHWRSCPAKVLLLSAALFSFSINAFAAAPIGDIITLYSELETQYVTVGTGTASEMAANTSSAITAYEQFIVEDAGNGKVLLKSLKNNMYARLTSDSKKIKAIGTSPTNSDNQWDWEEATGNTIHLKNAGNNNYMATNNGGTLKANSGSTNLDTQFTWAPAGSSAASWRVIAADPRWPTNDEIVVFCEVTDAEFGLPTDTINNDCTSAFQAAVDACAAVGGGTVFVPEGEYRVDGPLVLTGTVTLRGRWRELKSGDTGADLGTVIRCESETVSSVISNGQVMELTFWHPNQKPANGVTVYPPVIRGGSTHVNITFINAYEGIRLDGASNSRMEHIYGSPLHIGLYSGPAFAVPGFKDIHFSPDYIRWSGLESDQSQLNAHDSYMYANGTAVIHDGKATFYNSKYRISGYKVGLQYSNIAQAGNSPHGTLKDVVIDNCQKGIQFLVGHGVKIKDIDIHDCLDAIYSNNGSEIKLTNSSISGINYDVRTNASSMNLSLINTAWSEDSNQLSLGSGQLKVETVRKEPTRITYNDYERKPLKPDFFNVKDSQFGAIGNGVTDDTSAIVAAVNAAKANGGGIVFFPAGVYPVTVNLDLGLGIELRGSVGTRQQIESGSSGSTLQIEVPAVESGPAFITLGDNSGVRGLAFYYPNQTSGYTSSFIKYAYTIRGNGIRNYVVNCSPINPYRFVEFNGDDNLMWNCFPAAVRQIVQSNNNRNGRYEDNMAKPTHWPNSQFPFSGDKEAYKDNVTEEGLELIYIKDCDDYSMDRSFLHGGHRGVTIDNSGGDLGEMKLEQVDQGYAFISGSKRTTITALVNGEQRVGPDGIATDSFGIKLFPGFTGSVECYVSDIAGEPIEAWAAESGFLYIQNGEAGKHQHGAVSTLRTGVNGSIFLENCELSALYGIENEGSLKLLNCTLANIPNVDIVEFGADNYTGSVNVLSDPGQVGLRDYGLILDLNGLVLDQPSADSILTYAVTTNGMFDFTVEDPDFLNDSPNSVKIGCDWLVSGGSTVQFWYYSGSGWTLADTVSFSSASDTLTRVTLNNPAFGQQGSGENFPDLRVVVTSGNSPKLRAANLSTAPWEPIAPKAPTGLVATLGGSTSLDWDDNSESGVSYNVYRREGHHGAFGSPIATSLSSSSYSDGTGSGANYFYAVTAVDGAGRESSISEMIDAEAPAIPVGLQVIDNGGSVSLDWDDNTEADLHAYGVYRADTQSSNYLHLEDVSTSRFLDQSTIAGNTYYYVITALDFSGNESGSSSEGSTEPPDTQPPFPSPSTWDVLPTAISDTEITMTATTATDPSGGILYRFRNQTLGTLSAWQSSPTYTETGLTPGTTYVFRVKTMDALGNSGSFSSTESATTFSAWSVLLSDDFNAGWGNWGSGGSNSSLQTDPDSSSQALRIRKIDESLLSSGVDVTGYNEIQIAFTYLPISMDNSSEGFVFEYSDDGGTTWNALESYYEGIDFTNNVRENPVVIINNIDYNFSSNAKFRFQCVASGLQDFAFIDDVVISVR